MYLIYLLHGQLFIECLFWGSYKYSGLPHLVGLPDGSNSKESAFHCSRWGFLPWIRKIPWKREWQPTPAFLPGKSHGQRSLAGYSPWRRERVGHDLVTKQQWLQAPSCRQNEGLPGSLYPIHHSAVTKIAGYAAHVPLLNEMQSLCALILLCKQTFCPTQTPASLSAST